MRDTSKMVSETRIGGKNYGIFYSPAGRPVFSAERIQQAVSVFDSRPIVPSSDVTSWKSFSWISVLPAGTSVYAYARTAETEADLETKMWSGPFLNGLGDLSGETQKILQFRLAMSSSYDAVAQEMATPLVTSATASCYIRGLAQAFYTKEFNLSFLPKHIILTYNGTIPPDTIIQFAVSTGDSTNSKDYKIISANTVTNLEEIARQNTIKIAVSAVGNTEVPFVIDEFAFAVGGDGFDQIQ
jgi:hypothetical protein